MTIEPLPLSGLARIRFDIHADDRGQLMETYREDFFAANGLPTAFRHEYQSTSKEGVLRGLHFQWEPMLGKLMRISRGRAFLVAADIRPASPTLGKWYGAEFSAAERSALYAPPGFATGLLSLEDGTELICRCTAPYSASGEASIRFDDETLAIAWPREAPILSPRDQEAQTLSAWLARPESKLFI